MRNLFHREGMSPHEVASIPLLLAAITLFILSIFFVTASHSFPEWFLARFSFASRVRWQPLRLCLGRLCLAAIIFGLILLPYQVCRG